ncbi:10311_t:CDS:2, partial [Acaulospora colombiana]
NNVMRQERPELFVGIPEKNVRPPVTISLDTPLTNVLPVAVEESVSLMNEITFELEALSGTAQNASQSGDSRETVRNHVRNPSGKLFGLEELLMADHISPLPTIKKESPNVPSSEELKRKESSGPFKGGSLLDYDEKNPPIKQQEVEVVKFAKGSLLASSESLFEQAKEREKIRRAMGGVGIMKDSNSSTLVQMNEGVRFHKGSLLAKSTESPDYEVNERPSRLNRKPSNGTLLSIDLPVTSPRSTSPRFLSPTGNGKPLLDINMKTESQHTLELRNANFQPLLSFVPGEQPSKSPRLNKSESSDVSDTEIAEGENEN